ncbi:halocyanin domain-containing protein [Halovenus rubra]|uniref:Halocyanin domain-containing protein n=2 Tax=Halovenus rubra TaxID=869890 RepID=A0ABD5X1Z1_9EURY|nr:halocyanin domain-containing protein [Halovenus rubra]
MTEFDIDRRKVLKAGGAALMIATAGCSGDGGDGDDGSDSEDGSDGSSDGSDGSSDGSDGGDVPSEVDDHLSNANGYEGSVEDMTGQDSVTIENGVNEPDYAFGPAAVRVDKGAEVTWEWVSAGHSVVATDGADFSSDIKNSGFTFSHTFEESGVVLYECGPHSTLGQLGAVVVE